VVTNSLDGRDVISAMYYAALKGEDFIFSPPVPNAPELYGKIGSGSSILIVQSSSHPALPGMADDLRNKDNEVDVLLSENPYSTNLELARMSGATSFVLVDPVYGYNTISALAYAKMKNMYLIFVDGQNAAQVVSFLKERNPQDLLLYGYTDSNVKDALESGRLPFREINYGDKFEDNLELVRLYQQDSEPPLQVILSDGNAVDDTIAVGDNPVVLISPVIPSIVRDFIKENAVSGKIPVALVVEEGYAQTAYDLKSSINSEVGTDALHVFVKFGESSTLSGGMLPVEFFPLPGPVLGMNIVGVDYNKATSKLEITYENTGNAPEYVKSTILVFTDGEYVATLGDEVAFPLGKGEKSGRGYEISIEEGQVSANITSMFGSSRRSAETGIQVLMSAGTVAFLDESLLGIDSFSVDGPSGDLYVTFSNLGASEVYFQPYAIAEVEGRSTRLEDDKTYGLSSGESRMLKFPAIAKGGGKMVAGADYGSREAFLNKNIEEEFVPPPSGIDPLLLIGALVLLAVIAGAYFLTRKK
ncbi:MAG: hypothetical protein ABII71_06445, partial [Candidatus Micrarchaeota archaeon]